MMCSPETVWAECSLPLDTHIDCWEFHQCGRQPGGPHAEEMGVCPAAIETEKTGPNNGKGYGRYCWRVAGTLCNGQVQGNYAAKMGNCEKCPFFQFVQRQEGDRFRR